MLVIRLLITSFNPTLTLKCPYIIASIPHERPSFTFALVGCPFICLVLFTSINNDQMSYIETPAQTFWRFTNLPLSSHINIGEYNIIVQQLIIRARELPL